MSLSNMSEYQDPRIRKRKRERDLRLLGLELQDNPDEPFTLFNLGQIHQEAGDLDVALNYLRRSLSLAPPGISIVRKLYSLIAQILRAKLLPAELCATCRRGTDSLSRRSRNAISGSPCQARSR